MEATLELMYKFFMFKLGDMELYVYIMIVAVIFGGSIIGENFRFYNDPKNVAKRKEKSKNNMSLKEYKKEFMSRIYASTFLLTLLSVLLMELFKLNKKPSIVIVGLLSFFNINKTTAIIYSILQNLLKIFVSNLPANINGEKFTGEILINEEAEYDKVPEIPAPTTEEKKEVE